MKTRLVGLSVTLAVLMGPWVAEGLESVRLSVGLPAAGPRGGAGAEEPRPGPPPGVTASDGDDCREPGPGRPGSPRSAPAGPRVPAPEDGERRWLEELHVGPSLPTVLARISDLAARLRLPPPAVIVSQPLRIHREARGVPTPWLLEYPVRVTVVGSGSGLLAFARSVGHAALPLRVESAHLGDQGGEPRDETTMRLALKVLAPVQRGGLRSQAPM